MSDAGKRAFELNAVRELFRAKPEILRRSWRASPDPEVDVLVAGLDDGVIGVEVSRLLPNGGEKAKEFEAVQDRIVARAMRLWAESNAPPLEVVVFWNVWTDPTTRRQTDQVSNLVAFVNKYLPPDGEAVGFDVHRDVGHEIPFGVDAIEIRRFNFPNHWHCPRGGVVGEILPEIVAARLAVKNAKAARHRAAYDERWLVLVVGTDGPSSWAAPTPTLLDTTFESLFDRVSSCIQQSPRSSFGFVVSNAR